LKADDHIVKIGDHPTAGYDQLTQALLEADGKPTNLTLVRGRDSVNIIVVPEDGKLGFGLKQLDEVYPCEIQTYNIFQAVPKGISDGTNQLVTYVGSLKYLFTKKGATEIGGFGAIGNLFPEKWNWFVFWNMAAFLSIILAFMNILPIPALDGGHVMFVLWEIITGRKPSDKFLEYAQMAGMFLLLALLLYANANDIYRFVFK
ncbi:MAG: site-2 protease family protein, partial [Muribaculaceae bacterium]|nr:site-2 protease family protein [Muribaculaceae bacterium]